VPGIYSQMLPFHAVVAGALTVSTSPQRLLVPFPYEVVGVSASVNTAPTGASIIVDVLAGANQSAPGSLTSIFAGNTALRPTILAGTYDNVSTDTPFAGDPTVPLNTVVDPNEKNYLAKPQAASTTTFSGNQPVDNTQPQTITVNAVETGSANQYQMGESEGYLGNAGDLLQVGILQIGSTVAGADLAVIIWVLER